MNEFHSIILDERCLSTFCIFEIHNVYFNTMYSSSLDKRSFGSEIKSNKNYFILHLSLHSSRLYTTAKQIVSSKTTTRNKTILTCLDLKSRASHSDSYCTRSATVHYLKSIHRIEKKKKRIRIIHLTNNSPYLHFYFRSKRNTQITVDNSICCGSISVETYSDFVKKIL